MFNFFAIFLKNFQDTTSPYSLSKEDGNVREGHWHLDGCPHQVWLKSVHAWQSCGRFILKKFEIFAIFSGFLKNFLRQRFPEKNWPGNVLGETFFVFVSVRLKNKMFWTLTFRVKETAPLPLPYTKKNSTLFWGKIYILKKSPSRGLNQERGTPSTVR